MDERVNADHPDSAELQMYADSEPHDDRVARHVESCAICRDEVAAVRRVTAALALGSRPHASLLARIQSKRADADRPVLVPSSRSPFRARAFALPVGLAAAAALLIFAPRAWREDDRVAEPGVVGAKGPLSGLEFETVLTGWRQASVDSVVRSLGDGESRVEVRYNAGRGSDRAEQLADRVTRYMVDRGVSRSRIDVRRMVPQAPRGELPGGAVAITVRAP